MLALETLPVENMALFEMVAILYYMITSFMVAVNCSMCKFMVIDFLENDRRLSSLIKGKFQISHLTKS